MIFLTLIYVQISFFVCDGETFGQQVSDTNTFDFKYCGNFICRENHDNMGSHFVVYRENGSAVVGQVDILDGRHTAEFVKVLVIWNENKPIFPFRIIWVKARNLANLSGLKR